MPLKKENTALKISSNDNVAVAITEISAGDKVRVVYEGRDISFVVAKDHIPMAHKIALVDIAQGEEIYKYGECIGEATSMISAGSHVHIHNVKSLRGSGVIDQ